VRIILGRLLLLPRRLLLERREKRVVGTEPAAASTAMHWRLALETKVEKLRRRWRCDQRHHRSQHDQWAAPRQSPPQ
jgi:hypothetical protein